MRAATQYLHAFLVFLCLASAQQQQCDYLWSYQSTATLLWDSGYSQAVATITSTCDHDEDLTFKISSSGNFADPIVFGPYYTMTEANYTLFTSGGKYASIPSGSGDASDYLLVPGCVTVSAQTLVIVVMVTYGTGASPGSGSISIEYSTVCPSPASASPFSPNAALIGGLVGGVGGSLLLFCVLLALCQSWDRKRVVVTQTTDTTSSPPPSVVIPMPVVVPVASAPPPVTNVAQSSSSSAPVINFSPVITVTAPTTQSVQVDARASGGVPPTPGPEDLL